MTSVQQTLYTSSSLNKPLVEVRNSVNLEWNFPNSSSASLNFIVQHTNPTRLSILTNSKCGTLYYASMNHFPLHSLYIFPSNSDPKGAHKNLLSTLCPNRCPKAFSWRDIIFNNRTTEERIALSVNESSPRRNERWSDLGFSLVRESLSLFSRGPRQ